MATLVNKMNREVKVIIPNMREFRVFYSDNEGSVMFFKRDWVEEKTKQESHWKPSEEQMEALEKAVTYFKTKWTGAKVKEQLALAELYEQLKKL